VAQSALGSTQHWCCMRDKDLFQLALSITSPWFVASSEFDAANKRIDIALDFKRRGTLRLPRMWRERLPCARHGREDMAAS
jgi:hypothetical protein